MTAILLICPAAAIETIDNTQMGSLTVQSNYSGQALTDMPFAIYRVADVSRYGMFTLLPQYEESGAAVNKLEQSDALDWRTQAQKLAQWIQTNHLSADAEKSTNKNGTAVFSQLDTGLYLVIGSDTKVSGTQYHSAPFLVSVPEQTSDSTAWTYAVMANPKSEPSGSHTRDDGDNSNRTDNPSDKLDEKTDNKPNTKPGTSGNRPNGSDTTSAKKNLPYTGILQWPIPVLAGTGLVLMILGWNIKKTKTNK